MKRAAPALEAALSRLAQRQLARARTTLQAFAAAGTRVVALAGRGERVLLDRLSHASLIDGALLSGARLRRYRHADAPAAAGLLGAEAARTALIATDGVFSMDGDLAPLPELARAARAHQAWL